MARKKQLEAEKRHCIMPMRCTEAASAYVRSMALTGQVIVQQSVLPDYALVEQWRRVGVNLNQLTHLANAGKDLPRDELVRVLAQVEALLDYGMGIAS
jgi:Bacterial mobilisation protein (MobC)